MSVNGDTKDSESSSVQSENAIEQNSDSNKTVSEPKLCNRCGHPVSESSSHDCIEKLVEEVAKLKTQNKALQQQVDDLLSLQDYEDDPNQDLDEDLIFIRKGPVTNTYYQYVRELKVVRKLITRFMDEDRHAVAEPLCVGAIDDLEQFGMEAAFELANMKCHLACMRKKEKKFQEAIDILNEALGLLTAKYGEENIHVGATLGFLAEVHFENQQFQEAEAAYKKAIPIYQAKFGFQSQSAVRHLNNAGLVLMHLERFDEAEFFIEQTLAIFQKFGPGYDLEAIDKTKQNLAIIYANQGRYDDSENLYKHILLRAYAKEFRKPVVTSGGAGGSKGESKRESQNNKQIWELALEVEERKNGLLSGLWYTSEIRAEIKRHQKEWAMIVYKRAFIASVLNGLSDLYRLQGKTKAADLVADCVDSSLN